MKTSFYPFKIFLHLTVTVLILGSTSLIAQDEPEEVAKFKISIESSKKAIKLVCLQGCNWKELHYRTTSANILQAVNQYGMTDLTQREVMQSEGANYFLFTIETSENTISLKGIEGTAWKELSFSCNDLQCKRIVDAFGVGRYVNKF
jgi:hypothetical protein